MIIYVCKFQSKNAPYYGVASDSGLKDKISHTALQQKEPRANAN